jgi:hypothetical protein
MAHRPDLKQNGTEAIYFILNLVFTLEFVVPRDVMRRHVVIQYVGTDEPPLKERRLKGSSGCRCTADFIVPSNMI